MSSFLFLRRSKGRRYGARKETGGEKGAGRGQGRLVQRALLPSECECGQPAWDTVGPDQEKSPGVVCWSQGLLLIDGGWGGEEQSACICLTAHLKTKRSQREQIVK